MTEGAPCLARRSSPHSDAPELLVASLEARSRSPRIVELSGRLAAALGAAPAARRALREAFDLYRAIGATGNAERLAREMT
jgi:hypothetical protein